MELGKCSYLKLGSGFCGKDASQVFEKIEYCARHHKTVSRFMRRVDARKPDGKERTDPDLR